MKTVSSGKPAMVASDEFRTVWEGIFGKKQEVGEA